MLLGQFDGKISEKHQVSLPKKFREVLGGKLIVTKGFEHCLIVVSEKNWKTLLEGTEGRPFTSKSTRELQRFLLGNAVDVELDTKGRFVLPEFLRAFAKIKNDVLFAGISPLGGGGHTLEILERGGKVLAIDQDPEAMEHIKNKLKAKSAKYTVGKDLILVQGNFSEIDSIINEHGFEKISGALFDLGLSSHQLETPERGFSFGKEAPLDMRMSPGLGVTAADLINGLTVNEMTELFRQFGEESFAGPIAKAIVSKRHIEPILTTVQLAQIIARVRHQKRGEHTHPATRVFQALRIAVNDELNSLKEVLPKALTLLEAGGRIAVISFHSLEDRIVKQQFLAWKDGGKGMILTKKPIVATEEEIARNPRSRSAKLRIFEKL